jgi:hypothetical protein
MPSRVEGDDSEEERAPNQDVEDNQQDYQDQQDQLDQQDQEVLSFLSVSKRSIEHDLFVLPVFKV